MSVKAKQMTEWNEIQQNWEDYKTKVLSNWNMLTPELVDNIDGNQTALFEAIKLTFSCNLAEAEHQVINWQNNLLGSEINEPLIKNLDEKLKQNQDTPETIEERDSVIGSPFHKGY